MLPFRSIPRRATQVQLVPQLRLNLRRSLQQRCYSSKPTPPKSPRVEDELKRQARAAALKTKTGTKLELPEKLVIYHAGTGSTTFLAMIKITSIFVGAFFCCVVAPSYVKDEKPSEEVVKVTLCGIIPVLFVLYTSAPYVTHIYIHLPAAARASRSVLERFVKTLPPSTQLTVSTMSAIGKPRYSIMQAGDLLPAKRRFGVVNYIRNTKAENKERKWYNFRAVGNFHIRQRVTSKPKWEKKNLIEGWIWDTIKERIAKKAGPRSA